MEYKVIFVKASGLLSLDAEKSAADLARQVNEALALGWEPTGGVALTANNTHLAQALVKRR